MADRGLRTFEGVALSIPSKVMNAGEEDWEKVDWANLSTGELAVHRDYLLLFKAGGSAAGVQAKSLGNLLRASEAAQEGGKALSVTTSDTIHKQCRFTFRSSDDAAAFHELAKAAEKAAQKREAAGSAAAASASAGEQSELEETVRRRLAAQMPLIFGGVELFGASVASGSSDDVCLGRGLFALVDPAEVKGSKLGQYALRFFGEDEADNLDIVIAHQMGLRRAAAEATEDDEGASTASFQLPRPGSTTLTISFDSEEVAAAFERDYRVRQRVMELATKTVKGQKALQGALAEMEERSIARKVQRFLFWVLFLFFVGCAVRSAMLFDELQRQGKTADKGYVARVILEVLGRELVDFVPILLGLASRAGNMACQYGMGAVPRSDALTCLDLESPLEAKRCLTQLLF
eukprot:TRINITY_DN10483_c0_g2_i1.p1 TRINITY_DN10483_c0_g2~~TRINITY_DN10483_c0_g2_i1.p1  ORF type:complete len:405 (-),score=108.62 TRINITY_DN10483_c0_g2_i1:84-1298(-)